ncbi:MAG TPA: SAM-dependent chlorinase/fluorinase [Gemmatimonadaceae bacterium]|nr:SAM-dependent chlorinase/fluorinase [Gemmatimonadaceae bacterium]
MSLAPAVVTLLTDFGTADGYVGEMKGVLASLAPGAPLVDITHEVPAHDVESGRLALARSWRRFPPGTVHLAVVDPGVGSARRALAVQSDGRLLVGPDNGLLSPALLVAGARVVQLPIPPTASATFHGRDVFAPAAAALATGAPIEDLGHPVEDPIVKRTPEAHRRLDGSIEGQVIAVDRFGNAITNLVGRLGGVLEVDGARLPVRRSYSEVDEDAPAVIVGSTGLLEVSVRDGSGAERFGLHRGSRVVLHPR